MDNSPNTKTIYRSAAARYHALVTREDYESNLTPAILAIDPLAGKDVIELGAGTGRLTRLVAPILGTLIATDSALHMLSFGKTHLKTIGLREVRFTLTVHQALPFPAASADLVIAGWSFCYVAIDAGDSWERSLEGALDEVSRVLRPGGGLILIESLGTGFETPHAPAVLAEYLDYLKSHGFRSTWIRTDYCFKDQREAEDLTTFFFGCDPLPMWETERGVIVPECTGLWWKVFI